MRGSELEKYDSVKRWFEVLSSEKTNSFSTMRVYLWALDRWIRFTGMTPDQLVDRREEEILSPDRTVKHRAEELLKKAFNEMAEEGKSRASCWKFFGAVKSFYNANYCPLYGKSPSTWPTKVFKVPNQEEIRLLCENAEPMMRLWILSQKDSGISGEDLIQLRFNTLSPIYGTIGEQLKSGQVPIHVYIMRGKFKAGGYYDTYLGEETFNALQESGDKDGKIFDTNERTVRYFIAKYARRAQLKGGIVSPHCLRKFFNTYAKIGVKGYGATELLVEYWMGHSLGRTKGAYLAPPVEEQQKIYLSAYPMLRCLGQARG